MKRREFLQTSLAVGFAAPLIVTARQVRGTEANEKIRIGIVGCGGRGAWIADLFRRDGNYEFVSVADYHAQVSEDCGKRLGVPSEHCYHGLSGYRKTLDSKIDAIALEAVPYFYPEHVAAAVDAGKHVYMAKPIAVDVWGTREVAKAAARSKANGKVFLVDFQIPTDPGNGKVLEHCRRGEIGKVLSIQSCYVTGGFPDPPFQSYEERLRHLVWVNDDVLGGGYHVNACIHGVEAGLELASGELPVSAQGYSSLSRPDPHGDSHDSYALTYEFADGRIWTHHGVHRATPFWVRAVGHGESGAVEIGYNGRAKLVKGGAEEDFGEIENLYEAGAVRNIAKFVVAIRAGDVTNDTVDISVNANLVTLLGRHTGKRREKTTMADLLKENHRLELDTTGWIQ